MKTIKESTLWIVYLAIIVTLLFLISCESPEVGGEGCCWRCEIHNVRYEPQPGVDKVLLVINYSDSLFCYCSDEVIDNWERNNTWKDTINGIWTEQVGICER